MQESLINLAYLLAAVLFILGLKGLASPRTAVRANKMGAFGMLIAILATVIDRQIVSYEVILAGIVVGSLIGLIMAVKVQMTGMPQKVALLNGFGGGASLLVAGAALIEAVGGGGPISSQLTVATVFTGIIGSVTFFGSLVAFGKLQGILPGKPLMFPGQSAFNAILILAALGVGALIVIDPQNTHLYWAVVAIAAVLGVTSVIPIGGADMPVVITLLNSYSGLAACATGFVLNNNGLIISGSLVGASGIILTQIMCKAMNRSLGNVLFGGVGAEVTTGESADEVYAGKIKSASAEEIAMILEDARRVAIIPGYGMAVSQAQHAVRDLANLLESRGVEVQYGVHPVAGRMPGHMNVLLAEAQVPYDEVFELDDINSEFAQTDVAFVIGANDVTNPSAKTDPTSPIYGMPVLDVERAGTVLFVKRSLASGYAGVDNDLFYRDNNMMLFGDAKKMVEEIVKTL